MNFSLITEIVSFDTPIDNKYVLFRFVIAYDSILFAEILSLNLCNTVMVYQ